MKRNIKKLIKPLFNLLILFAPITTMIGSSVFLWGEIKYPKKEDYQ